MSVCHCKTNKPVIEKETINDGMLQWMVGKELGKDLLNIVRYSLGVVVDDRGYLRLVDVNDYSCLDHGENIKIKYCPFCGKPFDDQPTTQ
jgi:hypothetical protein